jgi:hypothetical protein
MSHAWHLRVFAQAGLLAGLVAMLGGCLSAPKGPTSEGAVPPAHGNVTIAHVAQRYIEETNFKRISEYFDNQDNHGDRVIERTDPKVRTGYYFIVDLAWHPGVVVPAGTKVVLDYVRGDNTTPRQANFVIEAATGTWPEIFLGLTGADWPRPDLEIVAYKLTIESADGQVLAERHSFLWDMPVLKTDKTATATATPTPAASAAAPVVAPSPTAPVTPPAPATSAPDGGK